MVFPSVVTAGPKISIGKLSDYLRADKNVVVKRVYNHGDATAFVKVRAWELVCQADGSVEEIPSDVEAAGDRHELMVSPARLIIPASGLQTVRLLLNGPRDKERYFRLRFNLVLPNAGDGFELTWKEADAHEASVSGGVQMPYIQVILARILEEEGMRVVAECADGVAGVAQVRALAPTIVVLELALPGLDGMDVIGRLRKLDPAVRLIGNAANLAL